jgi:Glycosyl hydrolase family 12/Cellulose binding domain
MNMLAVEPVPHCISCGIGDEFPAVNCDDVGGWRELVAPVPSVGHGRWMSFTSRPRVLALVLAGGAGAACITAVVPSTASSQATAATLCRTQTRPAAGGSYTVANNEWGSGAAECITAGGNAAAFRVARSAIHNATSGAPGGYPSVYKGCHWGACTAGSGFPVQVARLRPGRVTTSWSTSQPGGSSAYDVAYDIWFNQSATTNGQPNGAELMIWLNHHGSVQPFGSEIATNVSVGGRRYNIWFGKQGWNTISYTMASPATSVSNLGIGRLAADAVRRGYIRKSWYLVDVEAGFELWQGGAGLTTNSFSVRSGGGSPSPGPRPAPGRPSSSGRPSSPGRPSPRGRPGAAACSVTYSVVNTWPGGFQGQAVITNTARTPVNGWALGWTFPGEQKITGLWNGSYTQSGEAVRVTNASYNPSISPGGTVTVGFTGSFAGSDTPPSAFTLNGRACG